MRRALGIVACAVVSSSCSLLFRSQPNTRLGFTRDRTFDELHQCAVRTLDGLGFTLVEVRRADGVVQARQGDRAVDVLIFEDQGGRSMRVTGGKFDGGQQKGPDGRTRDAMNDLFGACTVG